MFSEPGSWYPTLGAQYLVWCKTRAKAKNARKNCIYAKYLVPLQANWINR